MEAFDLGDKLASNAQGNDRDALLYLSKTQEIFPFLQNVLNCEMQIRHNTRLLTNKIDSPNSFLPHVLQEGLWSMRLRWPPYLQSSVILEPMPNVRSASGKDWE